MSNSTRAGALMESLGGVSNFSQTVLADAPATELSEAAVKKSSWKEFLAQAEKGLAYMGSQFNSSVEKMVKAIDKNNIKTDKLYVDRKLIGGVSSLKMAKFDDKGKQTSTGVLTKAGTVSKYGDFFIIYNAKDGDNVVVYAVPGSVSEAADELGTQGTEDQLDEGRVKKADLELIRKHLITVANRGDSRMSYSAHISPKADGDDNDTVHKLVIKFKGLLDVDNEVSGGDFADLIQKNESSDELGEMDMAQGSLTKEQAGEDALSQVLAAVERMVRKSKADVKKQKTLDDKIAQQRITKSLQGIAHHLKLNHFDLLDKISEDADAPVDSMDELDGSERWKDNFIVPGGERTLVVQVVAAENAGWRVELGYSESTLTIEDSAHTLSTEWVKSFEAAEDMAKKLARKHKISWKNRKPYGKR